jgi:hypothetical protein
VEVEQFFKRTGANLFFRVLVEPLEKDFDNIFDNIFEVFFFPPVLSLSTGHETGSGFILFGLLFWMGGLFDIINLRVYFYITVGILEVELILNFNHFIFEVDKGCFGQFVIFINSTELVDHVDPLGWSVFIFADL